MSKLGFGSFQISRADRRIIHKSGVQKIVGWPIQKEGFAKAIGFRFSENQRRKVIGIGLGKTGTTSLAHCLTYLGYRHQWYSPDLHLISERNKEAVLQILSEKDSCEDFPWPYLYRDIDTRYPDSKFILTLRKDPETWYKSLCKHFDRGGRNQQKAIAYGYETPHGFKKQHIDLYIKHAEDVKNYFSNQPTKLLTVCWENGDGWAEICDFLDHTQPEIAFPHANRAPKWQIQ